MKKSHAVVLPNACVGADVGAVGNSADLRDARRVGSPLNGIDVVPQADQSLDILQPASAF